MKAPLITQQGDLFFSWVYDYSTGTTFYVRFNDKDNIVIAKIVYMGPSIHDSNKLLLGLGPGEELTIRYFDKLLEAQEFVEDYYKRKYKE